MTTFIMIFMAITIAVLYVKLFGKQIVEKLNNVYNIFVMKSVMRQMKGQTYYDENEAQEMMMWFNKMFWGTIGYRHPQLYKNNNDPVWIIKF